ncbi:MAG: TldD/PmbA family protein [Acidimicrobiales bacterium]
MTTDELLDIGDRVVGWARDGEQVEAVVVHQHETEIRVYEGEIESFTSADSHGVGIRVIVDNRQGIAHAGTLDDDVLGETLAEARDNAAFGTPDEFYGLAAPDGVPIPDLDLYDPAVEAFATADKIDLALELERAVRGGDSRIIGVESADYVDSIAAGAVVSTMGIRHSGRDSGCYLAAYSLAADDDDTQTGFGYSVSRSPLELDAVQAAADAVDRATRLLGAKKPRSERLTVVLDPYVTAQFLGIIGSTMSAESVLKGRSLFADRLGEEIGATCLTLVDDPTDPEAFTATDTDGEGLAAMRNVLIDDGRLDRFLHNTYTARRMGAVSTASAVRGYSSTPGVGPHALSLVPGVRSQQELVAGVGEGMLIQGVTGLNSGVNIVSGDFSTGAEGLRIRGGELAEPVREATIASTLQRMLLDVREVGNDLERLPMHASGVSLVVADITLSGE